MWQLGWYGEYLVDGADHEMDDGDGGWILGVGEIGSWLGRSEKGRREDRRQILARHLVPRHLKQAREGGGSSVKYWRWIVRQCRRHRGCRRRAWRRRAGSAEGRGVCRRSVEEGGRGAIAAPPLAPTPTPGAPLPGMPGRGLKLTTSTDWRPQPERSRSEETPDEIAKAKPTNDWYLIPNDSTNIGILGILIPQTLGSPIEELGNCWFFK